jgi:hypothetical protein
VTKHTHIYIYISIFCIIRVRSAAVVNIPHNLHSSILHQRKLFDARLKTPLWKLKYRNMLTQRIIAHWNIFIQEKKVFYAVSCFWYCEILQRQSNINFFCLHFNVTPKQNKIIFFHSNTSAITLFIRTRLDERRSQWPRCLTFWHRNFKIFLVYPVCKMWIIQEPKKLALWNKRNF